MLIRIFNLRSVLAIALFGFFAVFATTTAAAAFDPSFGVTLSSNTPGSNADFTLTTTQPTGDEVLSSAKFTSPVGWNFASGSVIAQDAVVASGTFTSTVNGVPNSSATVTIKNDQVLQGHKAHWKILFGNPNSPAVTLDSFLDGNSSSGHTFTIARAFLVTLEAPVSFNVTFLGTVGGVAFSTNPAVQGDYTWSAEYASPTSVVVTRSQTLTIPSTTTPIGSGVEVSLANGAEVTFSSVTGAGETTIATSATAPPQGTGQFQFSPGGLYYDYNTTATFSCPCTITLPYNPATTPSPRIYHLNTTFTPAVWEDITTSVDTVNHTVTGVTNSFSFFAVGTPSFNVSWREPISKKVAKANPFNIEDDDDLGIKFNLLDGANATATPANVTVEVWQTKDASGSSISPAKVLTLEPRLQNKKSRFGVELDLEETPLGLGVYEIRVLVDNTTATQSPATAAFKVVGETEDDSGGSHVSVTSGHEDIN